ncbi:MAG: hypothetical protein NUV65_03355 [Candidatus Roizmanbacteria bacterium]|nr:hypothetical protein [Candidatus Roizmanbacteria bacterium]
MYLAQVEINKVFAPAANFTSVGSLINLVIRLISLGAGAMFMFTMVYASYQYITSDGEEEKINKAKKAFVSSSIGMILVVVAYWAVQIIARYMGLVF